MNQRGVFLAAFVVIFLVPQVALAVWWNPLTWFDNWSFLSTESSQVEVVDQEIPTELEDSSADTPTDTKSDQPVVVEEKPKSESVPAKQTPVVAVPTTPKEETSPVAYTSNTNEWEFVRPYNTLIVNEYTEDTDIQVGSWDDLTVFGINKKSGVLENSEWTLEYIKSTDSYKSWEIFDKIAGKDFIKNYVNEYMTYDLSSDPILAFVEYFTASDAPWYIYKEASELDNGSVSYGKHDSGWGLAVNLGSTDFSDVKSVQEHVVTLLHEYAHILTLNRTQVDYDMPLVLKTCPKLNRYLVPLPVWGGCAEEDSYIQAFFIEFWNENYSKNGGNFVTKYAATNPREDIAESFTNFILQRRPTDIKDRGDQKIDFFYNYPELVTLRTRIRANIATYFN